MVCTATAVLEAPVALLYLPGARLSGELVALVVRRSWRARSEAPEGLAVTRSREALANLLLVAAVVPAAKAWSQEPMEATEAPAGTPSHRVVERRPVAQAAPAASREQVESPGHPVRMGSRSSRFDQQYRSGTP